MPRTTNGPTSCRSHLRARVRQHVLGERRTEGAAVVSHEGSEQPGVHLLAPVADPGGRDHECHPAHAVAVAGGEVLRDHPAVGLTHHEVDATAEPLGDGVGAVVGHVGDRVARRQVAPARHVPDGVARVDERVEPPSRHPAAQPLGQAAARTTPEEEQRLLPRSPGQELHAVRELSPDRLLPAPPCGSPPSRGSRPTVAHPDAGREGFEAAGSHRRVGHARDDERGGQADLDRGADDVTGHATEPAHRVAARGDGAGRACQRDHAAPSGIVHQGDSSPVAAATAAATVAAPSADHGDDARRARARVTVPATPWPRPAGRAAGMPCRAQIAGASRLATSAVTARTAPRESVSRAARQAASSPQHEHQGGCSGRAGVAPTHHLERPLVVVTGRETVGEVGETVEVQRPRQQRGHDESEHGRDGIRQQARAW